MATGAAEMMLRYVCNGSISMHDMDIERRPYHRNCRCALHKSKGAHSNVCFQHRNISFPQKQSWNHFSLSMENGSLSVAVSKLSSQSSLLDDSSVRNREGVNETLSSK